MAYCLCIYGLFEYWGRTSGLQYDGVRFVRILLKKNESGVLTLQKPIFCNTKRGFLVSG